MRVTVSITVEDLASIILSPARDEQERQQRAARLLEGLVIAERDRLAQLLEFKAFDYATVAASGGEDYETPRDELRELAQGVRAIGEWSLERGEIRFADEAEDARRAEPQGTTR